MPATQLADRIRKQIDRMGDGARAVAEFAMAHPEEVALLPAARVGERLGVSESTVTRFAVLLGYDGYPALRKELQNDLRRQLLPPQRLQLGAAPTKDHAAAHGVFRQDVENILRTERSLTNADLDICCNLLSAARRIYVVGPRMAFGLAHALYFQLHQMLGNCVLVDSPRGESFDQLLAVGPDDVVVVISFPRHPIVAAAALKYARAQHAKAIAITDGPLSPIATDVDLLLTVTTSVMDVYTSLVGGLSLVNAVCSEVALRNKKRVSRNLQRVEELLKVMRTHVEN